MQDIIFYLRELPFWANLKDNERELIRSYTNIRKYEKNALIHSRDSECMGLIRIIEGSVRTYMISDSGREISLYHMQPGDCDVLSASCVLNQITFETMMSAETDAELIVIPASVLSRLKLENINVRSFIYEKLSERFSDAMWAMQQLLFLSLDKRVASYLIDSRQKSGSDELRLTHEKIAKDINSAREAVARMLKGFEEDGIIIRKRAGICITDMSKLKAVLEI